ncbi:MAG: Ig-like domain-containing protein [Gammaproteobacteria bacterium]|nr:Ig-like domain-containing protein [Gammaproteobacteria bacterium]
MDGSSNDGTSDSGTGNSGSTDSGTGSNDSTGDSTDDNTGDDSTTDQDLPVNTPPTAVADSFTAAEDTLITDNVLANDNDPEGSDRYAQLISGPGVAA